MIPFKESLVQDVKVGLAAFLTSPTTIIRRADFPWGSIYWVGTVLRIDIKVENNKLK